MPIVILLYMSAPYMLPLLFWAAVWASADAAL